MGRESGGILVLLILTALLILTTNTFLTLTNLDNLVRQVAVFAILSVGQLFVILTGGIDLSVGSVLGLSGGVTALLLANGVPIPITILVGLLVGLVVGLTNGLLVSRLSLPPFIATLGMLGVARGLVLLLTGARTIAPLPDSFTAIANGFFLGLPSLFWILVIVALIASFVLARTVFGRYVYAVGSNAESTRLSGVPVNLVLLAVYSISGILAGFAGILTSSRLGAGIPTAGTGYELQAIAGAVIGGASLSGAKGRTAGAVLGALIMGILANGGNLLAIDPFYQQIAIGLLIILAVYFDHLQGRSFNLLRRAA
jgi:ribose transport system permease protein